MLFRSSVRVSCVSVRARVVINKLLFSKSVKDKKLVANDKGQIEEIEIDFEKKTIKFA